MINVNKSNFYIRWKNASAVVKQLKNNEWSFRYNDIENDFLTATRNGRELWLGNGSFWCDVDKSNSFGLLLRHYVYWRAAYWKLRMERKNRKNVKLKILYED